MEEEVWNISVVGEVEAPWATNKATGVEELIPTLPLAVTVKVLALLEEAITNKSSVGRLVVPVMDSKPMGVELPMPINPLLFTTK